MTKFFTEAILSPDQMTFTFSGEEARYLTDVLRSKPGEAIVLCDGAATDHVLEILELTKHEVKARILSSRPNDTEPPYKAVLYQALVKGDKFDLIIQKSVELGVSSIIPVICSRSVVKVDMQDSGKKRERWQKIALEAARQSGRGIVPEVSLPVLFRDALSEAKREADLVFLPWEGERAKPLADLVDVFAESAGLTGHMDLHKNKKPDIRFFIGPEGGFSPEEIALTDSGGVQTVSLGKRILRTETAGLFVLSSLVYRLEAI